MADGETRVAIDGAAPSGTAMAQPGGALRSSASPAAAQDDESRASASDDGGTPRAPAQDRGRKESVSGSLAPAAARSLSKTLASARPAPRDPSRVLKNRHLRKFRAFAQAVMAFNNNRWQTVEMGRPPASSGAQTRGGARLADAGRGSPADKPCWILHPNSLLVRSWELFMIIPILYTASITPYRVFFEESTGVRGSVGVRRQGLLRGLWAGRRANAPPWHRQTGAPERLLGCPTSGALICAHPTPYLCMCVQPVWLALEHFIYATFVCDLLFNFLFGYANP